MSDKEPKQRLHPMLELREKVPKERADKLHALYLGRRATKLAVLNASIADAEAELLTESHKHRELVDGIQEGARVSVMATGKNVIRVHFTRNDELANATKTQSPFTGIRVTEGEPGSVLKLYSHGFEFYASLDANNSEGEYQITKIDQPEDSEEVFIPDIDKLYKRNTGVADDK